jgi:hypothetical protein
MAACNLEANGHNEVREKFSTKMQRAQRDFWIIFSASSVSPWFVDSYLQRMSHLQRLVVQ